MRLRRNRDHQHNVGGFVTFSNTSSAGTAIISDGTGTLVLQ